MKKEQKHNETCIFCKIINEEIPSYKIFENKNILAFLDAFPTNLGHILIIPKVHSKDIFEIQENTLIEISQLSKILADKLKLKLKCDGINILQNNNSVAGQEVMHYHMHIIPRYKNDKIEIKFHAQHDMITKEQAQEVFEKFK